LKRVNDHAVLKVVRSHSFVIRVIWELRRYINQDSECMPKPPGAGAGPGRGGRGSVGKVIWLKRVKGKEWTTVDPDSEFESQGALPTLAFFMQN
jgi:hypothetical protein